MKKHTTYNNTSNQLCIRPAYQAGNTKISEQ